MFQLGNCTSNKNELITYLIDHNVRRGNFKFDVDAWNEFSLSLTMNSSPTSKDGSIVLRKNRDIVIADWNYSDGTNPDYWKKMAKLWMVDLSEAKRQRCSNCDYFDNKPECLEKLESVAEDAFDEVGGRGKCTKFDFIAHDVRVCQAWEEHESHQDYED